MKVVRVNPEIEELDFYSKIQYSNSVGVLFDDSVLLPSNNRRSPIYLDRIKKVRMIRVNNYWYNFLFFVIALSFAFGAIFLNFTLRERILMSIFCIQSLLGGVFFRKVSYRMLINLTNLNIVELHIPASAKADAKLLTSEIGKFIRKANSLRKG